MSLSFSRRRRSSRIVVARSTSNAQEEEAVGSRAITVMNRSWESHCQAATRHTKWPPFSSNVTTCYCIVLALLALPSLLVLLLQRHPQDENKEGEAPPDAPSSSHEEGHFVRRVGIKWR